MDVLKFHEIYLFAIEASPFNNAIAIAVKTISRVFFDVDEESDFTCVFSAAAIAIVIGAHVVNHSVNRRAIHTQAECFEFILIPIFLMDSNDVVLAHPFFGHLTFDSSEIAGPCATVVFNAFFAAGLRPRRVPCEISLMPDGVSNSRRGLRDVFNT